MEDSRDRVDSLAKLCRAKIPKWKPTSKDHAIVSLGVDRLGEQVMEDLILRLAIYQAATNKYTNLQRTLANWINRENPVAGGSRIDADDELDRMCRLTDELYEAKHAR